MVRAIRVVALGLVAVLAAGVALLGAVGTVRALRPVDTDALAAEQVAHLGPALADGAAQRMAALFPEGAEFTAILPALAALDLAERGRSDTGAALALGRDALRQADDPAAVARFGVDDPPGGVFLAGWALHVAVRVARVGGQDADRADAVRRAQALQEALTRGLDAGRPFLPSYPDQVWPVDTVGAVAALDRVQALAPDPARQAVLDRWRPAALALRDGDGLLPHRVGPDGTPDGGPRATSSSLMVSFWPEAFADPDPGPWRDLVRTFVVRRAGLVGLREYPSGSGPVTGDVDSGPLLAGVSLSASVVALAGARRYGDVRLASALEREAEVLGLPVTWRGARRYAGGVLPVGDAFLAWARAQPVSTGAADDVAPSPRAVIWPWPALLLVLGGLALAGALRGLGLRGRGDGDGRGRRRPSGPPDRGATATIPP